MYDPFTGRYTVTQTWEQHLANAGPTLGGVDFAMGNGTPLPACSAGMLEWVTPASGWFPSWYNTGLGNAAAIARDDGTRTVYAHCQRVERAGAPIAEGEVRVWSNNTGKTTGPHVHCHDVLADGRTRARPFTTGGGSSAAGGGVTPIEPEDAMDKLTLLVETQQSGNKDAGDWWVVNYYQHTYYHVESMDTVNVLRARGVAELSRASGNGFQGQSIWAGFTRI